MYRDVRKKPRRGQIEMIGLVVVVILLSIGLLLYVKLSVFRDDSGGKDSALEHAYLTNLMSSVFNINVCDEDPVKIEEAVVYCFEGDRICGEEACTYVEGQINTIIESIGPRDYRNYSIWVERGSSRQDISEGCKTGILTHTTIVSGSGEHYTAYFRVC